MANGIRTGDPRGFNKGRSSKFREGSRVRQTPEEGRKTYWPNVVEITIKMKTIVRQPLMIKNQQASSQKFRQLRLFQFEKIFSEMETWIPLKRKQLSIQRPALKDNKPSLSHLCVKTCYYCSVRNKNFMEKRTDILIFLNIFLQTTFRY